MLRCSKTKGHPKGCPFVLGSAAQRAAPPFGITMLRAAKPPLRRGFACGKTLVRSTRAAGQKAGGVQFCLLVRNFKISKLSGYDTKRDICFADVLFCGFRRPQGGSTLRDFNARGGRAAPAPRFCLRQNARTAHPRRRPEGRWGNSPATVLSIPNIDFNRPFYKKGTVWHCAQQYLFLWTL